MEASKPARKMQAPQAPSSSLGVLQWMEEVLAEERNQMTMRHAQILEHLRFYAMPPPVAENRLTDCGHLKDETEHHVSLTVELPRNIEADVDIKAERPDSEASTSSPVEESKQPQRPRPTLRKSRTVLMTTLSEDASGHDEHFWHPNRLVRSTSFEIFYAAMIVLNAVVMSIESMYMGFDVGHKIGYPYFDSRAADLWPWAADFFLVMEWVFGVLFVIELLVKVVGLKGEFLLSLWNLFDAGLVIFWLVDTVLTNMPLDSNLLRLVRLARLLRLLKLARTVKGFDSLVVMTTALQGSMSALLWVGVLLLFLQMMFALLFGQALTVFIEDQSHPLASRLDIFKYFGTFPRAMLTMFELTLGNWVPVARLLQENVSELFVVFSILHKVIFGFACIGVVNGVFMQETLKVAQSDDVIMMRDAERNGSVHRKKMQDFFEYADLSGDGTITAAEWSQVLSNPKAKMWFAGQGLSVKDAGLIFRMMDTDRDGHLTAHELAAGVSHLQGTAKNLDVRRVLDLLGDIQETLGSRSTRQAQEPNPSTSKASIRCSPRKCVDFSIPGELVN